MSEVAPAGGGPNKIFIVLALGLVGLLIIGVVVIVGILMLRAQSGPPGPAAVVTPPTRAVTITFATTPTRAALVVFTPTAAAPESSPTATLVNPVVSGATTPVSGSAVTPTTSVTPGTGTPGTGMPPTGVGEDLLLLAGGIVLVFVIIAARRARSTVAA
jgi:hypothetical protein